MKINGKEMLYWQVEQELLDEKEAIYNKFHWGEIKTYEDAIRCGLNSVRIMNSEWGHLASGWLGEQGEIVLDISDTEMTEKELLALPVVADDPLFDTDDDGYTFMSVLVKEDRDDE